MKKILSLLIIMFIFAFAQLPQGDSIGEAKINYPLSHRCLNDFVDNYVAPRQIWTWNNNGDSVRVNDVVVWDFTEVAVVDTYDASGAGSGTYDTCTIADSLKDVHWNHVYGYFSNPTNDTLIIVGLDSTNVAQRDTIVKASGAGIVYSTHYWRKVSLTYVMNSAANIGINAVPYGCVKHTTISGGRFVAGIVASSVGDDELVRIITSGVANVKLKGNTTRVTPGAWIMTTSTAGYGVPTTAPNDGFGVALGSGNTSTTYKCLVNTFYRATKGRGTDVFTAQKTADTVLVSGLEIDDFVFITPKGSAAWTEAPTGNVLNAGSLVVYCVVGDTAIARASGYNYLITD